MSCGPFGRLPGGCRSRYRSGSSRNRWGRFPSRIRSAPWHMLCPAGWRSSRPGGRPPRPRSGMTGPVICSRVFPWLSAAQTSRIRCRSGLSVGTWCPVRSLLMLTSTCKGISLRTGFHVHGDSILQEVLVSRPREGMGVNGERVTFHTALSLGNIGDFFPSRTVGAGMWHCWQVLPGLRVTVGACQPFPVRVVHHRIPENAKMAGSAEPALLDQRQVSILGRDIIVIKCTKEQLVAQGILRERPAHIHGEHPGHIGIGHAAFIQLHIRNFMAEIAVDPESIHPADCFRIDPVGVLQGCPGNMAGCAVAGRIGKIQFVARAVIRLAEIRGDGDASVITVVGIAGGRSSGFPPHPYRNTCSGSAGSGDDFPWASSPARPG